MHTKQNIISIVTTPKPNTKQHCTIIPNGNKSPRLAKLTWMQRTGAHWCSNLILILRFIAVWNLLVIFCSSDQSTALHYAGNGHVKACELLIASNAEMIQMNATNWCAFIFTIRYWFCVVFFSCLPLTPFPAVKAAPPSNGPFERNEVDVVALLRRVGAAE